MITMDPEIQTLLSNNKAKLVLKQGWFWETLHYLVLVFTFGANRNFRSGFITTLGPVIGVPKEWDGSHISATNRKSATIRHELVHVGQFRKAGLGSAYLGIAPMFLLYVLLPLPIGFAWFRWLFERRAYMENLLWGAKFGSDEYTEEQLEWIFSTLCGGNYGWTLAPFAFVKKYVKSWFRKELARKRRN